jgi:RNA polymerase sigma factor (sigma-70 family)
MGFPFPVREPLNPGAAWRARSLGCEKAERCPSNSLNREMSDCRPEPVCRASERTFSVPSSPLAANGWREGPVGGDTGDGYGHLRLVSPASEAVDDAAGGVAGDAAKYEAMFLANLATIERVIRDVCQRQAVTGFEADEFASEVKLRLIDRGYAVFRAFQQRSSLRTYLTIVIQRIYLDYRNRVWGRWRPSAEARRLGPIGVRLETLMTRDGFSFNQACEQLRVNEGVTASVRDLEAIAMRLPPRPGRGMVHEEVLETAAADQESTDWIRARAREQAGSRVVCTLTATVRALSDQDRLILRLRFHDGFAIADIARALHLSEKPTYRRLALILGQLRSALETAGVDRTEAREIVSRNDVDISLALLDGAGAALPASGSAL